MKKLISRVFGAVKLLVLLLLLNVFWSADMVAWAAGSDGYTDQKIPARVLQVLEEKQVDMNGDNTLLQKLSVKLESGVLKDSVMEVQNDNSYVAGTRKYRRGDEVFLVAESGNTNGVDYFVYDYNRLSPLLWLFIIFFLVTVVIGRLQGLASFIGMACSFFIIFYFVLPRILAGANSFLVAIWAALIIVPVTFYLSHGFNRKTTSAITGTMLTLLLVGFLSAISVEASHITGSASEEVNILMLEKPDLINVKELLLAGIIISLLGILDDIAISQAAIVFKLNEVSPELKFGGLFSKAMDIGRDHIASVVNTLVLVYTGAALPMLLLFLTNPAPFAEIINEEFMAEEILRTLIASIGIVIAVPLTTLITVIIVKKWKFSTLKNVPLKHQH